MDDCLSFYNIPDSHQQKEYLLRLNKFIEDRKVRPDQVFIAYKGQFQGRIIIPIFDKLKNVMYFQGRAIDDTIQPKYINPVAEKHNIILNEHIFTKDKYIIVVEGLLDAMSIGNQGTTVLGREVSDLFLKRLQPLTTKGIILALDNDNEGKKALRSILKKSVYKKNLKYFLFPEEYDSCKDINMILTKYSMDDLYAFIAEKSLNYTKAYTELYLKKKRL
jgi:DNA primase